MKEEYIRYDFQISVFYDLSDLRFPMLLSLVKRHGMTMTIATVNVLRVSLSNCTVRMN